MAFTYTVTGKENVGSVNIIYGTFTNADTDSGGDITTGMGTVVSFTAMVTGQVGATPPKYSESGGVITLVTDNGVDGKWSAIGK